MRAPPLARSASLGIGDLEAAGRDARSQVTHRRPAEDVVGDAVGDVQAHEQPRPLGLLPRQAHEVPVRDADRLGGVVYPGAPCLHAAQLLGERLLQQGRQELILGVEVVVEGSDRDVCGLGDLGDRRRVEPLLSEEALSCGEQRAARARLAPLVASRRDLGLGFPGGHCGSMHASHESEYILSLDFLFSHVYVRRHDHFELHLKPAGRLR